MNINFSNCGISLKKNYTLCNNFPGNIIIPFNNANTPSTAIPKIRKGIVSIQKTGYNTKARRASGQQNIKRKIQAKNLSII
jgi:hypothetical protein